MPVLFSKSCTYAIHATLFLAARKSSSPVLLRDIARSLQIPPAFLSKLLQKLVHDGILASHRGSTGGFGLARPANKISVQDVVNSIDGSSGQVECLLGFRACADGGRCILHDRRTSVKGTVESILLKQNMASLRKHISYPFVPHTNEAGTPHGRQSTFLG